LCAVLGSAREEGYKNVRMCPKDCNEDDERTRWHDLGGAAEDARFIQLSEE